MSYTCSPYMCQNCAVTGAAKGGVEQVSAKAFAPLSGCVSFLSLPVAIICWCSATQSLMTLATAHKEFMFS